MQLMPNPAHSQLTIEWNLPTTSNLDLTVVSVDSKVVYQNNWSNVSVGTQGISLNSSEWKQGIYFVLLRTDDGLISKKIDRTIIY